MNKREIVSLLVALKKDIDIDYRASEDDIDPSMQVTIASDNDMKQWSYQTGDNSYTGGAYCLPHWAVISLYRDSNCRKLADDVFSQLRQLIHV